MRTIGLIGGMSWESSLEYYRVINRAVRERLGGLHSAKCVMVSVDFAEVESLQREARWDELADRMTVAARAAERGGADLLLICSNTMHRVADEVQAGIGIPLLHIVDATAERVKAARMGCVGLLGTRYTMEDEFYRGRLSQRHDITVIVPDASNREDVHRIIFDELCAGVMRDESRARLTAMAESLMRAGSEGVVLGCTELGLALTARETATPLFDSTNIHGLAAVEAALAG
jgi:aspartate racemase